MIRLVVLLAAITPPLLVLGYGIAKARGTWRSEAVSNAYFIGAVSAIAAIALEFALNYVLALDDVHSIWGAADKAVLLAALPEESVKFFVLVFLAEKHVDVRRLQDILVLALAVSLGFATFENFFYVISIGSWKVTAALRAITAVPGHGIDALAMGALLIRARLNRRGSTYALLVPIILHAAYDFPLFANQNHVGGIGFVAAWLIIIAGSSVYVIMLCNRVLKRAAIVDRASGRDRTSIETTDRLIVGGIIALITGPLLAASALYTRGLQPALLATVLSIFPVALGIDSILTGIKRSKVRRLVDQQSLDYAL